MDYKKSKAPVNTVTRNIMDLCKDTGNIYESVAIISKRANQISMQIKEDLSKKLAEFASYNDSLEEVFENREQIEISRYYEKLPKPSLLATQEFVEKKVYWRDQQKDSQNFNESGNDSAQTDSVYVACGVVVGTDTLPAHRYFLCRRYESCHRIQPLALYRTGNKRLYHMPAVHHTATFVSIGHLQHLRLSQPCGTGEALRVQHVSCHRVVYRLCRL